MTLQKLQKTAVGFQRRDIAWTDANLSRTPFHPAFWARKRIAGAIAASAGSARGVLLDVGCGMKPYEPLFSPFVEKYIGIEYSPESGYQGNRADIAATASSLPLVDECVDTILCTEVLEHVPDPEMVITEFARVLKPGGRVITTAPFFFPIHDSYDFFRYTDTGIAEMMKRNGIEVEKVEPLSGSGLTIALMLNLYIFDLGFMWTKWMYPIGLVLRPVLWVLIAIINGAGWIMEKVIPSKHMAFDHLTVGKKK